MINNRQNGRRRGRNGQRPGGGGSPGRPESGNRIDNRARGNASQLYEKYKTLAADAQRQGDRVNTEYYLQFADHYFRVLAESRPRFDEQQQARARGRDEYDDEFDGDGEEFGQEGEPGQPDQFQPRADDRPRQEARRDERPRQEERPPQQERPRQDVRRDERPRYVEPRQGDGRQQEQRPDSRQTESRAEFRPEPRSDDQGGRYQSDRPRRQDAEQGERPRSASGTGGATDRGRSADAGDRIAPAPVPLAPSITAPVADDARLTAPEPAMQEASTVRAADMDAPAPRRRGRPPRQRPDEAGQGAPVAAPSAEPVADSFDADRLPPSLSLSASAEPDSVERDSAEPAEKPRRRRRVAAPVEAGPAS